MSSIQESDIDKINMSKAAKVRAKQTLRECNKAVEKVESMLGHNSEQSEADTQDVGGVAGQRLLAFIERVERLEEEKAALMEDIKEVYAEAKGVGFDVKTLRKIVKLRKMDSEKRSEEQQLLELYASAIGLQGVLL